MSVPVTSAAAPSRRTTLWRVELLRLWRTRRWVALLAVYLLFGLLGPLSARYIREILARAGGDITIVAPDPVPADGLAAFVNNASQIGLVVVVIVAALALTLDARPGLAVFYRTRVRRPADLVVPRFVVAASAAALAYLAGLLAAVYETVVLLGGIDPLDVAMGGLLGMLYLVFAVAVVALAASRSRSVLATVGITLGALLALPIVGVWAPLGRWLPSALVGAQDALARGVKTPGDYLGATAVTLVLTVGLVVLACRLIGRRDL
ncbi:MAG TPA: ABC transporter [Actinomycetes bacterium]|nr:ABC transporter [Actinomycetes bacterium]